LWEAGEGRSFESSALTYYADWTALGRVPKNLLTFHQYFYLLSSNYRRISQNLVLTFCIMPHNKPQQIQVFTAENEKASLRASFNDNTGGATFHHTDGCEAIVIDSMLVGGRLVIKIQHNEDTIFEGHLEDICQGVHR
jgi:hypothetical protein